MPFARHSAAIDDGGQRGDPADPAMGGEYRELVLLYVSGTGMVLYREKHHAASGDGRAKGRSEKPIV